MTTTTLAPATPTTLGALAPRVTYSPDWTSATALAALPVDLGFDPHAARAWITAATEAHQFNLIHWTPVEDFYISDSPIGSILNEIATAAADEGILAPALGGHLSLTWHGDENGYVFLEAYVAGLSFCSGTEKMHSTVNGYVTDENGHRPSDPIDIAVVALTQINRHLAHTLAAYVGWALGTTAKG